MTLLITFLIIELVFFLAVLVFASFVLYSLMVSQIYGAPYVPLPQKSLKAIFDLSEIKDTENLYDLGAGDARVLIKAVNDFGIKEAVGYEVAHWPYWKAKFMVRHYGLADKITIIRRNFLEADLGGAKTVFMYLFDKLVQKAALKLSRELSPGAKIVCVSFPIKDYVNLGLELKKQGKADSFSVFVYEKM